MHPKFALSLLAIAAAVAPALAQSQRPLAGRKVPASAFGPSWIETMAEVERRQATMPAAAADQRLWNGEDGEWIVPPSTARTPSNSGSIAIVNKWGDPRIGIGFGRPTDVLGLWIAGHGTAPTTGIRLLGFRGGEQVAVTEWTDLTGGPVDLTPGLRGVDRIVLEARPVLLAQAWFALDDLVIRASGSDENTPPTLLDFEDLLPRATLTGSGYRDLTWEHGEGLRGIDPADTRIVHAPQGEAEAATSAPQGSGVDMPGLGTPPLVTENFDAVTLGDPGAGFIPPDTCGAMGTDHFVAIVNANMSAFTRIGNQRVSNVRLDAFWNATVGDPRIVFDPHSDRFIALATDFSRGRTIYLAISLTSDPTGAWFKWSFRTDQGSDVGKWPDYPTLGVDARGIYTAAYMVGGRARMTIWAIDKAPLLAPTPAIGTTTAWRSLRWEGAIQPCTTYGDPGGEYLLSRRNSTTIRLRRIDGPLTAPQLVEAGSVTVPSQSSPPDAPALGSATNISTIDYRPMNAVFRNGSVWAAQATDFNGRAAVRWYEIDAASATAVQVGTISDPVFHYYYGSIAVDSRGDVALGFSGSHAGVYVGSYVCGRLASDPPGETSPPELVKAGEAAYQRLDGNGRNRWGDYSHTTVDPLDDVGFWSIQEYAGTGNTWVTRAVRLGYPFVEFGAGWPGTSGTPTLRGTSLPTIGGPVTIEIGNPSGAATSGVLAVGIQQVALPLLDGTLLVQPLIAEGLSLPQAGANALSLPIPADPNLVSNSILLQAVLLDPGASQGVAFSPGLEIRSVTR